MNKTAKVLELLSREEDPMTVDRVAKVLGISKRKVYHIVLVEITRMQVEPEASMDEEE